MSTTAAVQKASRDRRVLNPFTFSLCRNERDESTVVDYVLSQLECGVVPLRAIFHQMCVEGHAPFILSEEKIRQFLSSGVVDSRRNIYTDMDIASDYCEAGTWLYCCYPLLRRIEEKKDIEGYERVWKRVATISRTTSQLTQTQARVLLREGVLSGVPFQLPFLEPPILALTDMLGGCGDANKCMRFACTRVYLRVVIFLSPTYRLPLDVLRIIIHMVWGCRLTTAMLSRLASTVPKNTLV